MLSKVIHDEIFNVTCRLSEMAKLYIVDELAKFGLEVKSIIDNDLAVTFVAKGKNSECELRIDRIHQQFEITGKKGSWTILPASGDWELVERYVSRLVTSIQTPQHRD